MNDDCEVKAITMNERHPMVAVLTVATLGVLTMVVCAVAIGNVASASQQITQLSFQLLDNAVASAEFGADF